MIKESTIHHHQLIMNNQHPIEIALAITLATIESVLWLINELAGFHNHKEAPAARSGAPAPTPQQIKATRQQQYAELVETYTVKQLRQLTGITTRRVLKDELKAKALCLSC